MQLWEFTHGSFRAVEAPQASANGGFHWLSISRAEAASSMEPIQAIAQRLGGSRVLDLHTTDLCNPLHPSHYDFTSVYDLIVFRRLAAAHEPLDDGSHEAASSSAFGRIHSKAVGLVVFDRLLISVHPEGCGVGQSVLDRLMAEAKFSADAPDAAIRSRLPTSSADLALRMINGMVDSYLELRRELTVQLDHWQTELLKPSGQFKNWKELMAARARLQSLEDLCEEQRDAMAEWLDATLEQPAPPAGSAELAARDQLIVRARDVIEHIQRVLHHARRLEHSAETVVQIHFSAQSNRTNDIMRTLTALTAIFLPLNLIAAIFGMNFEFLPWIHDRQGFWWSVALMAGVACTLGLVFWRKRYLARTAR